MPRPELDLRQLAKGRVPRPWVERAFDVFSGLYQIKDAVSVVLVTPGKMRRLNKQHRRKGKATNVLAFVFAEKGCLGEVFICPSIVRKEARLLGRTFKKHFQYILVHGLLHLVGMDHEKSDQLQDMERAEQMILKKL